VLGTEKHKPAKPNLGAVPDQFFYRRVSMQPRLKQRHPHRRRSKFAHIAQSDPDVMPRCRRHGRGPFAPRAVKHLYRIACPHPHNMQRVVRFVFRKRCVTRARLRRLVKKESMLM
jgi:hypothetical protein